MDSKNSIAEYELTDDELNNCRILDMAFKSIALRHDISLMLVDMLESGRLTITVE